MRVSSYYGGHGLERTPYIRFGFAPGEAASGGASGAGEFSPTVRTERRPRKAGLYPGGRRNAPEETDDEPPATTSHRGRVMEPAAFTERPRSPEPTPIRGRAPVTPLPVSPPPPPVVPRSELVKGYEYEKGRYVTVSKEDLEKITPQTAREMQILEFVKLADVDPIYFETSYYVTPEKAGERAYALLFEALRTSGYVAVAQFAMHNREHVVILRPGRTGIVLHTMFYETEIRRNDEYRTDTSGVVEKELKLALMLVENLAAPFDPPSTATRTKKSWMR